EAMATVVEKEFTVKVAQRTSLYTLLKSHEAEWTEVLGSKLLDPRDLTLVKIGDTTLLPIDFVGQKVGGATEDITIVADGRTWKVASGSASFAAMYDALVALVPTP
ncbi:MAG: hypothetical protein WCL50_15865, partial [Spirochaetota bacterium]